MSGVTGEFLGNYDEESKRLEQEQMTAEASAFTEQINNLLKHDDDLKALNICPIMNSEDLYEICRDGVLLCKLINVVKEGTIEPKDIKLNVDKSKLKVPGAKDAWEIAINNNNMLAAAKKIGCKIIGIGAEDIIGNNHRYILAVVWQLLRAHLMKSVNLLSHPELIRLLRGDEKIDHLLNLREEEIIKRWFNYHLKRAGPDENGHIQRVENFGKDVMDCKKWVTLLKQVCPNDSQRCGIDKVLINDDLSERAEALLCVAERLDCRQYTTTEDILNCRERLNLAFTATIFNKYIGISLPTEAEIERLLAELEELRTAVVDSLEKRDDKENKAVQLKADIRQLLNDNSIKTTDEFSNVTEESLNAKLLQVDGLKKSFEKYQEEFEKKIQMKKDEISKLQGQILDIGVANKNLQDAVDGKGNSVDDMKSQLILQDQESNKKSDVISNYVSQVVELYSTHKQYLDKTCNFDINTSCNDDTECLNMVFDSNIQIIKSYEKLILEKELDFQKYCDDEQKQINDCNRELTGFLGEGQTTTEDAITNMKRLLELMIEKCKKQAVHIQTQQITIEKKDAINAVMGAKIRDIALIEQEAARKKKKRNIFSR